MCLLGLTVVLYAVAPDIEAIFDLDDGSSLEVLVVGGSDVHIDDRLESFCEDDDDDDDEDICLAAAASTRNNHKKNKRENRK